jgi:hypothetical protein
MDEVAPEPNNATNFRGMYLYIYFLFCIIITRVPAGGGTCVDIE